MNTVAASGAEVGADEAVACGSADAAPAAADLHLQFHHALWLLAGVVGEGHREVDGETCTASILAHRA